MLFLKDLLLICLARLRAGVSFSGYDGSPIFIVIVRNIILENRINVSMLKVAFQVQAQVRFLYSVKSVFIHSFL
ncbi:hypothetical protein HanIR_Chr10g0480441 [Helianthus annuus]|nr:hypothetical protein HanIR_Chr10g0480441 [Helianthus annuus]